LKHHQRIIIDGYNVVYTDESLRRTACKDLERARGRLIEKLERYVADKKLSITVVFDGRGGMTDAESIVPGKLQVVFSRGHETADEFIVAALRNSPNPRAHIVVTSDMADIGRTARSLGAEVMGSKRFLARLEETPAQDTVADSEKPDPKAADTDFWMKRFSRRGRKERDGE
jgi:predicted RNA-binding protein with PIN domain